MTEWQSNAVLTNYCGNSIKVVNNRTNIITCSAWRAELTWEICQAFEERKGSSRNQGMVVIPLLANTGGVYMILDFPTKLSFGHGRHFRTLGFYQPTMLPRSAFPLHMCIDSALHDLTGSVSQASASAPTGQWRGITSWERQWIIPMIHP